MLEDPLCNTCAAILYWLKINFHGSKINFLPPWHPQTSVPATRAQVTLSFVWLAFAVKLVTLSLILIGWHSQ